MSVNHTWNEIMSNLYYILNSVNNRVVTCYHVVFDEVLLYHHNIIFILNERICHLQHNFQVSNG